MISEELKQNLCSFFNLERDEYQKSHGYLKIDEDKKVEITLQSKNAIDMISSFDEKNGYITVNSRNVFLVKKCVNSLFVCMNPRASWFRELTILL